MDCEYSLDEMSWTILKNTNSIRLVFRTLPFHVLIDRCQGKSENVDYFISKDERYYLRALGKEPRKKAALLERDFPRLWEDFRLPPSLVPLHQLFSTVLRVASADTRIWTHYDIMDNLLVQVVGKKRVTLFSPFDVPFMYLEGDKSRIMDVNSPDYSKYPLFANATHYVGELNPGDAIFIPALWFHTTYTPEYSVGVNIFWRHLDACFYDSKDLYGNRDLIPAQKALQSKENVQKYIKTLPDFYRQFYTLRFIEDLKKAAGLT